MKLQADEQVLHEMKPAPGLVTLWFFTRCLPVSAGGGAIGFFVWSMATEEVAPGISGACIAAASVLSTMFIYHVYLRRTYVYYVTNQRCIFHGGILRRVERSIPYHKITDVEMSQDIIERAIGISTLNLFTPGTASTGSSGGRGAEISFVGLSDNQTPAATVNDILRSFKATGE